MIIFLAETALPERGNFVHLPSACKNFERRFFGSNGGGGVGDDHIEVLFDQFFCGTVSKVFILKGKTNDELIFLVLALPI